jgi:CheY-like chemotaxis protein
MGQTANQRTILVVEDEPFIRMSAVATLEDAGFLVLDAKDSAEALRVLARHDKISILLTDVRMPGLMDGLALVAHVCVAYPAVCSLVVSANASVAQARDAGASGFLAKPYSAPRIVQAVHDAILRHRHFRGAPQASAWSGTEMTELKHSQLKQVVESRHGGKATFVQSVPVLEMSGGQTIANTSVSVFDLRGSTSGAFRAYAWAQDLPDGQQTYFAVLHSPWVVGPTEAVRAAIAAETRAQK